MVTLSIIIPTYNYGHFVARAVESAVAANEHEIIVLDDGSTDNTAEVLRPFQGRIRYVHQANGGPSAARNRGIDEARGSYLLFLDADDALMPRALSRFEQRLSVDSNLDMLFGGYRSVAPDGRAVPRPARPVPRRLDARFRACMLGRLRIAMGAAVFHRRVFDTIRFPQAIRNLEDRVVFAQTMARYRCATFTEPVLDVHAHDGRTRLEVGSIDRMDTRLTDALFNEAVLPRHLMRMRNEFHAHFLLARISQMISRVW
ncbi:MAG: hypothetical protein CMJ50_00360 [Planctomycetaceae bacterium]|nr:hypothetical protein [Planctomycetaceae bacterium]